MQTAVFRCKRCKMDVLRDQTAQQWKDGGSLCVYCLHHPQEAAPIIRPNNPPEETAPSIHLNNPRVSSKGWDRTKWLTILHTTSKG